MIEEFKVTVIGDKALQARAFDGTSSILIDVNKSDTISKVFEKLENGRNELSIENEKLHEENEKVASKNMELQEENNHLKTKVEELEQMYKEYAETKEDYQVGKAYKKDDTFNYNGTLYTVVQDHTSQSDWKPDSTPALYKETNSTSSENTDAVLKEFKKPLGSNPYKLGDRVIFNGRVYKSTLESNTWSPAEYPQGWKDLGLLEDYKG